MSDKQRGNTSEEVQIRSIEVKWAFFGKIVESATKWGSAAFGFWCVKEAWIAAAGTVTIADLRAAVDFGIASSMASPLLLVFGVGGVAYGRYQARLRKSTVERLHPYQEKYEKSIDPNRTSSRLTSRGDTRPEDKG